MVEGRNLLAPLNRQNPDLEHQSKNKKLNLNLELFET